MEQVKVEMAARRKGCKYGRTKAGTCRKRPKRGRQCQVNSVCPYLMKGDTKDEITTNKIQVMCQKVQGEGTRIPPLYEDVLEVRKEYG